MGKKESDYPPFMIGLEPSDLLIGLEPSDLLIGRLHFHFSLHFLHFSKMEPTCSTPTASEELGHLIQEYREDLRNRIQEYREEVTVSEELRHLIQKHREDLCNQIQEYREELRQHTQKYREEIEANRKESLRLIEENRRLEHELAQLRGGGTPSSNNAASTPTAPRKRSVKKTIKRRSSTRKLDF